MSVLDRASVFAGDTQRQAGVAPVREHPVGAQRLGQRGLLEAPASARAQLPEPKAARARPAALGDSLAQAREVDLDLDTNLDSGIDLADLEQAVGRRPGLSPRADLGQREIVELDLERGQRLLERRDPRRLNRPIPGTISISLAPARLPRRLDRRRHDWRGRPAEDEPDEERCDRRPI